MESHLDELKGAVRFVLSRPDIRADRVVVLGHSEGALHVLHLALEAPSIPLAGVVLASPPGRPVGQVARAQVAAQLSVLSDGARLLEWYDAAVQRFVRGEPIQPHPSLPQGIRQMLQSLEIPANLPFARELWMEDAGSLLKRIHIPTLIIIGKKDLQVDWEQDGKALANATLGRKDVTFLFPENANHVLKYESRPRSLLQLAEVAQGYNADDTDLDPEALGGLLSWLRSLVA
jgi:pimeloyl-ACP methyl ester carboxylesterase